MPHVSSVLSQRFPTAWLTAVARRTSSTPTHRLSSPAPWGPPIWAADEVSNKPDGKPSRFEDYLMATVWLGSPIVAAAAAFGRRG